MSRLSKTVFLLLIWQLSAFSFSLPAAEQPDAQSQEVSILARLKELELAIPANSAEAGKEIRGIFATLDRHTMPLAWISALSMLTKLGEADVHAHDLGPLLESVKDKESLIRLHLIRITRMKSKERRSTVLSAFDEAKKHACEPNEFRVWCGRIWIELAYYHYDLGEAPNSTQALEKAMQLLKDVEGRDRVYYFEARADFANLLYLENKLDRVIRLCEENFKWFHANGFKNLAALSAYNLANTLLEMDPPDIAKAQNFLKTSLELAIQTQDTGQMATVHFGQGKLYLKTKNFSQAWAAYEKAYELYLKASDPIFAGSSKIKAAQALLALDRRDEVERSLVEAEKLLPADYSYDRISILELRHEMALRAKDYRRAHDILSETFEAWKKNRDEEVQKEMHKLSSELGLQIEEQRNHALQQENALQAQKLKEAERFRIFVLILGILSLSTLGLLILSLRQNKRILLSKRETQLILDNIDEGLLTVGMQQKIGPNHSKFMEKILAPATPLYGQDFIQTVFASSTMSSESRSIVHEVLDATLGEERIAWEMNAHNLPKEVVMGDQTASIFTIRWIPIFDKDDVLRRLLVSLHDVTQARALEKALGATEKRLQSLPDTMRELLQVKPALLDNVLTRTEAVLESLEKKDDRQPILRDLHTQKGLARTLGLRSLSQDLHELESNLQQHEKSSENQVGIQLDTTRARIQEYRSFAQVLRQHQDTSQAPGVSWLASAVDSNLRVWLKQMNDAEIPIREFRICDAVLSWPTGILTLLQDFCLHGINNSLDHGFTLPKQRGASVARPVIEIAAQAHDGLIHIEVRDNGVGLDVDKLQAIATAKGFVPKPHESITDVLFFDGVSTADRVTLTSGRGVGLAAIKASIEEQGGSVGIRNNDRGEGTLLWARLPIALRSAESLSKCDSSLR